MFSEGTRAKLHFTLIFQKFSKLKSAPPELVEPKNLTKKKKKNFNHTHGHLTGECSLQPYVVMWHQWNGSGRDVYNRQGTCIFIREFTASIPILPTLPISRDQTQPVCSWHVIRQVDQYKGVRCPGPNRPSGSSALPNGRGQVPQMASR